MLLFGNIPTNSVESMDETELEREVSPLRSDHRRFSGCTTFPGFFRPVPITVTEKKKNPTKLRVHAVSSVIFKLIVNITFSSW